MQVTQVFFSDSKKGAPASIVDCMKSVANAFPDMNHVVYDLDMARDFIKTYAAKDVLQAFDGINPYAYKADLFRYLVLYVVGGWYFDSTVRMNASVSIPDNCNSVAFRDFPVVTNSAWSVWNGALFARAGHAVYERAINLVIENYNKRYYGTCNLCPTGPVLLGRAFAMYGDDIGNMFFNCTHLTPGYAIKNPALVLSDGTIFAYLKNTGQVGLAGYGASGTNSYAEMYNRREVYCI